MGQLYKVKKSTWGNFIKLNTNTDFVVKSFIIYYTQGS